MKDYKKISDEELIENVLINKDANCFEEIYNRYASNVFSKCLTFTQDRDSAADLTQEIFVKIYLQLDSFHGKSKFSTWVYSLTSNYCIDQLRKKKRFGIQDSIENYDFVDQSIEDDSIDQKEAMMIQLKSSLEKVSELDRQILEMKYLAGMSIKAIQMRLQIGESAIKMRLKRAKERLGSQSKILAID